MNLRDWIFLHLGIRLPENITKRQMEKIKAGEGAPEHIQFPMLVNGNFLLKQHDPNRQEATFNIGIIHDSPSLHGKGGQFTFNNIQWEWFLALNKHLTGKWWNKIVNPNNSKYYMSERPSGRIYIPALGVFMGNNGATRGNQVNVIGWFDKVVEIRAINMNFLPQPENVLKDPALYGIYNGFGGGHPNFTGGGIIIPNILPASGHAYIARDLIQF